MKLRKADVEKLTMAIEELYYFEFVVDDLPVRGFIGQYEDQVIPGAYVTHPHIRTMHTDWVAWLLAMSD